jgi:hypothetical protein
MKYLDFKQPRMSFVQIVDFKSKLAAGETISWVGTDVRVILGTASDASQVVASALASASTAKLVLHKGTHGVTYEIEVLVSTSSGNVEEEELELPIWDFSTP